MHLIENDSSNIVHITKRGRSTLCGWLIVVSKKITNKARIKEIIKDEEVMCKRCLSLINFNRGMRNELLGEKTCKYPDCIYYSPNATRYCCNACCGDHWEYRRLKREEQKMEELRAKIIKDLKARIESHHTNFSIKLEKKALKALVSFVERHADIYATTSLSTIITKVIEEHCAYLKEYTLS